MPINRTPTRPAGLDVMESMAALKGQPMPDDLKDWQTGWLSSSAGQPSSTPGRSKLAHILDVDRVDVENNTDIQTLLYFFRLLPNADQVFNAIYDNDIRTVEIRENDNQLAPAYISARIQAYSAAAAKGAADPSPVIEILSFYTDIAVSMGITRSSPTNLMDATHVTTIVQNAVRIWNAYNQQKSRFAPGIAPEELMYVALVRLHRVTKNQAIAAAAAADDLVDFTVSTMSPAIPQIVPDKINALAANAGELRRPTAKQVLQKIPWLNKLGVEIDTPPNQIAVKLTQVDINIIANLWQMLGQIASEDRDGSVTGVKAATLNTGVVYGDIPKLGAFIGVLGDIIAARLKMELKQNISKAHERLQAVVFDPEQSAFSDFGNLEAEVMGYAPPVGSATNVVNGVGGLVSTATAAALGELLGDKLPAALGNVVKKFLKKKPPPTTP